MYLFKRYKNILKNTWYWVLDFLVLDTLEEACRQYKYGLSLTLLVWCYSLRRWISRSCPRWLIYEFCSIFSIKRSILQCVQCRDLLCTASPVGLCLVAWLTEHFKLRVSLNSSWGYIPPSALDMSLYYSASLETVVNPVKITFFFFFYNI